MAGEVLSSPFLHKRGTSSKIATYAGPYGELVVDTTNNTVVVQTGSAGGVALAKATTTVTGSNGVSVTGGNLGTNIGIALATVSGLTTGTYGPQANATPAAGGTFTVPSLTVDSFGRVTSAANRTVTIPSNLGGSVVSISNRQTSGTRLATLTIDGTGYDLYYTDTNTDTNTHNTAYLYVGTSSGTSNASTSNGSTYLILNDGGTYSRRKITGSGSVSVSSDSSGNITITGTDTHNTASLFTGLSNSTSSTNASNSQVYLTLKDGSSYSRQHIIGKGNIEVNHIISEGIIVTDNRTNIIYMSPSGNDSNDGLTSSKPIKTSNRLAELLYNIITVGNYSLDGDDGTLTRQSNCIYVIMAGGTYSWSSALYLNSIPATVYFIPNGNVVVNSNSTYSFEIRASYVNFGSISSTYYPTRNSTAASTYSGSFNISDLSVGFNSSCHIYCNFTSSSVLIQGSRFSVETGYTFNCSGKFEVKDNSHAYFNGTSHTIGYFYLHAGSIFHSGGTGSFTINSKLDIMMYSKAHFKNTGGFTINCQDLTDVFTPTVAVAVQYNSYAYFNQPFSINVKKDISYNGTILYIRDSSVIYAPILLTLSFTGSGKVKYFMQVLSASVLTLTNIYCTAANAAKITSKGCAGPRSKYFDCTFYNEFTDASNSNNGFPGSSSGSVNKCGEFTSDVYPAKTNSYNCGKSGYIWSTVYAKNTAISTSDKRLKTNVDDIPSEILDIWEDIKLRIFKWTDSETPRLHAGIIAQDTEDLFKEHGLDIRDYSFFCYDKWDDEYEEVPVSISEDPEENIVETRKVRSAGDSYAIRYEEFLVIEAAYQRRRADRLQAQLDLLAERVIAIEKKLP